MKNEVELLSPVGDFECLKAAVQNGANAVYFGASQFNARASATNFDFDELEKVINYCALRNVKTHLTLNILIKNHEFKDAVLVAKKAYELGIDALIVQDLGLAKFLMKLFPDLPIHASTQMTIHNLEGVQELEKLGYSRAVLSRELSIQEIEYICANSNIEIETFIHGALCICYSGQCLFSSMVGGRSGNRGRCAQPCRLPYQLIEEKEKGDKITESVIDKGYLISPRDLCSLDYIPQLINAGVKCFKIEGRLKSPEYVAVVTRIYRKYIDMVLENKKYMVDEKDIQELKQIFNRGGFSTGHLSNKENRELVYKEKPNNMGIYIGNVAGYNKIKGHVKLSLNDTIEIGDTINFENENTKYTVSELMQDNSNISEAHEGSRVTIGRMKGNIKVGDKIYKLSSKKQMVAADNSFKSENIKLPLRCNITIKKNQPIDMEVGLYGISDDLYKNINIKMHSNIIPEKALNNPITKERIISQIRKTNDTPFEFSKVDIELGEGLFITKIKELNELRRMSINKIESTIISRKKRDAEFKEEELDKLYEKYLRNLSGKSKADETEIFKREIGKEEETNVENIRENKNEDKNEDKNENADNLNTKNIALYFNIINPEYDYTKISETYVSCAYVPLRYFAKKDCEEALQVITNKFKTYIYMPAIIKSNYKNLIKHKLEDLIAKYNISGFVISSLGDFILLSKYKKKYEFIGNFTFNAFNTISIDILKRLGTNRITLSPELNLDDINNLIEKNNSNIPLELIVYGNTPVMKMNYCILSNSNKCYPECQMRCTTSNKYYLRDRLRI